MRDLARIDEHGFDSQLISSTAFMLLSTLSVAIVNLLAKQTTLIFGLSLSIILRFLVPMIVLVVILSACRYSFTWSKQLKVHIARAIFVTAGQYCLFYYLLFGSLVNGALLANTAPLFISLIAMGRQRKRPSMNMLVSIVLGFLGVVFVLQPQRGLLTTLSLVGLLSGFFTACSQILNHKVSRTESDLMVSLHLYLFCSLISLFAISFAYTFSWINIRPEHTTATYSWVIWLVFTVFSFSSQIFRSKAYLRVKNASTLAPLLFTTVIFSSLLDWLVYKTTPNKYTILGGLLIFISTVVNFKSAVKRQDK